MTIVDAIRTVMRAKGEPMTAVEVHAAIASAKLYAFQTDNPAAIVRAQLRRHSQGLHLKAASKTKHFRALGDGRFEVLQDS